MATRFDNLSRAVLWTLVSLSAFALPMKSSPAVDAITIGVLEPFTGPWAKNGNESYVAMEIGAT